jgi:hypothetical protein
MKRILPLLAVMLLSMAGKSQTSNLAFFTENGERFSLVLNGMLQNGVPETYIKVTDLPAPSYKVKILFADNKLGQLNKTIYIERDHEVTYSVRLGKKGHYVIRMMNAYPLAQAPMPEPGQVVIGYQPNGVTPGTNVTTTVINNTTINNNVNVSANGVGNSVNVSNDNQGAGTQQTETNAANQHQHGFDPKLYVLPGYNGPYGCPWPMAEADFIQAKQTIASKSFEDSKLTIAKQIVGSNCLLSWQVKEIMLLFTYESSKLEFAKFAFPYTLDQGNYFKVNDAFTYESSIDDLNKFLQSGR